MTQTYRDMHKINELAQALIEQLEKYKKDIELAIDYEAHLEKFDPWNDPDELFASDLEPELVRVREHIARIKQLTVAE